VEHLTANGTIRIRRTIYWCTEQGTDSQLDRWLGIADSSVSVAARELCCRATVTGPSFRKSAENLERLGQIRVSSNRLRQIVEDEGQRALRARDKGLISPGWDASDCKTDADGSTRVMVGADEKISVSDGAEWIRKQLKIRLPMLDAMVLDYYHLTEHVAKAANACFGQGSEKAQLWRKEVLGLVWQEGPAAMLVQIHETHRSLRSPTKREELRKLEQYVAKRVDMLDYPTFRAAGFDLGSGPTEAFCKTLTARLKGSGMRWDSANAEGMMALAAIDQSGQWQAYWNLQNAVAA